MRGRLRGSTQRRDTATVLLRRLRCRRRPRLVHRSHTQSLTYLVPLHAQVLQEMLDMLRDHESHHHRSV
jgi:hypothetical protein